MIFPADNADKRRNDFFISENLRYLRENFSFQIIIIFNSAMNLIVDIGNTNTKLALFVKNEMKESFRDDSAITVILQRKSVKNCIVSRTGANPELESRIGKKKINTLYFTPRLKIPLKILYKTPETLGYDRIAGAVAVSNIFPAQNVLKIDFGTCITYDFVNAKGEYIGGGISPGMMMRFKALHSYTQKLPLVDPMEAKNFNLVGTDTPSSIRSGVIFGIKNEVLGIINEYESRFGSIKIVATGGDEGLFVTLLEKEIFARPFLVAEGLNAILNYNLQ